jgi:NAD(P)-dependent dehydrogenase (short-subunit alcohol dehydrogenase family)
MRPGNPVTGGTQGIGEAIVRRFVRAVMDKIASLEIRS